MLLKLNDNRVRRAYHASGIINDYTVWAPDNCPEDWVASCTTAFNPGMEEIPGEGLSVCSDGLLLKDVLAEHPAEALGKDHAEKHGNKVTILVKLLDAGERLSLQCHPTDEFAQAFMGSPFGKTECWYMVETTPDACVYLGFKEGITRKAWVEAFEKQDVAAMLSMLHRVSVQKGDVVFVAGGTPHAIGKGCFLTELQQPTDLMVIPEKVTVSGRVLPEAKIHGGLGYEKMMDCFTYEGVSEETLRARYVRHADPEREGLTTLVGPDLTDQFRMQNFRLKEGTAILQLPEDQYRVLTVLSGSGTVSDGKTSHPFKKGDKYFVGACTDVLYWAGTDVTAILCSD